MTCRAESAVARVGSPLSCVGWKNVTAMRPHFDAALENVVNFGDTDIFPFPFENYIMRDRKARFSELLETAFTEFGNTFIEQAPSHINILAPIGMTGFRSATQLDPFWNAFLLGITLSISRQIERARIELRRESVYSYRVADTFDGGAIFRSDVTWRDFMARSAALAKEKSYVVVCDISDCYQRVPHHRLENALRQIDGLSVVPAHIMTILGHFSNGRSYSLPVGGPAARILAECFLNLTDQLLKSYQIQFTRYADDCAPRRRREEVPM
jgi:Reverse transcriptase (RNA-dependent DNA polymerase)